MVGFQGVLVDKGTSRIPVVVWEGGALLRIQKANAIIAWRCSIIRCRIVFSSVILLDSF